MTLKTKHIIFFSFIASVGLLVGCEEEQATQKREMPLAVVTVESVLKKEITAQNAYVARVEAIDTYEVRTRVEGFIQSKNFVDGTVVAAGDVLFEIEKDSYQNQVKLIEADIRGAEATRKEADLNLKRGQELISRGNISQAKLDAMEAELAKAIANIDRLNASLHQAELELSYTTIATPISGRIGKTAISLGNLIKPGSEPLAQVVSLDPIYVSIAVSEKDLLKARRNGLLKSDNKIAVRLRLADGEFYNQKGDIDFIDNKVDPTTDTITVRATFANPDHLLFPNQFASMVIDRQIAELSLVVPQAAIQENQGGQFVLIVDEDHKIKTRNVELGREDGEYIIVRQGLEEGEDVVVQGLQKVRPGQHVEINRITDKKNFGN